MVGVRGQCAMTRNAEYSQFCLQFRSFVVSVSAEIEDVVSAAVSVSAVTGKVVSVGLYTVVPTTTLLSPWTAAFSSLEKFVVL